MSGISVLVMARVRQHVTRLLFREILKSRCIDPNANVFSCNLEDEVLGNLPRVVLCSHIFCTTCLRALESPQNVITCPECEVSLISKLRYLFKLTTQLHITPDNYRTNGKISVKHLGCC